MGIRNFFTIEKAIIKNDLGRTVHKVKIKRNEEKFTHKNKTYNVVRDNVYYDETRGMLFRTYRFFYNVNNPMPLTFNKASGNFEPLIGPGLYTKLLENEVLVKLNTVKSDWLKNIGPGTIIIILIVLALLGYAIQSGVLK